MTTVRGPDRRSVLKWAALGATALFGGLAARGVLENGRGLPVPGRGDLLELGGRAWQVIVPRLDFGSGRPFVILGKDL